MTPMTTTAGPAAASGRDVRGDGVRSVRSVRRRFLALTALRWLPTGLLMPVTVLLQQDRGLSLGQVGLVTAAQGIVVAVLELPTGGLADAVGRRPVLLWASVFDVGSVVLFAAAGSPGTFLVAWAIQGVYRALESGPLEAWFVDATLAATGREGEGAAAVERGLARAGVAIGVAISAGALGAAALVTWPPGGVDALVAPVLVSIAFRVVSALALAAGLRDVRPGAAAAAPVAVTGAAPAAGTAAGPDRVGVPRRGRARIALGDTAATLRSSWMLLGASAALRGLVAVELLWGAGLTGIELFTAPRLVELLGSGDESAVVFALAMALGWTVVALGSAATGRVTRLSGGQARAGAVLRLVHGASALLMAVVGGPAALVAGYLAGQFVHGTANVVHYALVHRLVDGSRRATILSAHSLAARAGGTVAAVGLGALASGAGPAAALAVAALLLAAGAPLYRAAGRAVAAA